MVDGVSAMTGLFASLPLGRFHIQAVIHYWLLAPVFCQDVRLYHAPPIIIVWYCQVVQLLFAACGVTGCRNHLAA
jgi:hypothetical protein